MASSNETTRSTTGRRRLLHLDESRDRVEVGASGPDDYEACAWVPGDRPERVANDPHRGHRRHVDAVGVSTLLTRSNERLPNASSTMRKR